MLHFEKTSYMSDMSSFFGAKSSGTWRGNFMDNSAILWSFSAGECPQSVVENLLIYFRMGPLLDSVNRWFRKVAEFNGLW